MSNDVRVWIFSLLQEDIHASHECSEQCTKPHDGPQLLVHHLQNKLLRLVHIHLVDALADDGADVDALKNLGQMLGDDGLINGHHRIHGISELGILTSEQVFHRPRQEFIYLTLNEIADDGITILLQYLIDVLGQKLLYRLTQQLKKLADDTARKEQFGRHAKSANKPSYLRKDILAPVRSNLLTDIRHCGFGHLPPQFGI